MLIVSWRRCQRAHARRCDGKKATMRFYRLSTRDHRTQFLRTRNIGQYRHSASVERPPAKAAAVQCNPRCHVGHGATAPATEGIGSSITADGRAATQSNIAKASVRQLRRSHDYPETHLNRGRRRDCCQKVDVIVAIGGPVPTRAAKSATSTIPIIFAHGGDPVSDGLVRSFKRAQNVDGSYAATAT